MLTTTYKKPKLTNSQLYSVYSTTESKLGSNPANSWVSVCATSWTLQPTLFSSWISNIFTLLRWPGSHPSAWEQIPKFNLWGWSSVRIGRSTGSREQHKLQMNLSDSCEARGLEVHLQNRGRAQAVEVASLCNDCFLPVRTGRGDRKIKVRPFSCCYVTAFLFLEQKGKKVSVQLRDRIFFYFSSFQRAVFDLPPQLPGASVAPTQLNPRRHLRTQAVQPNTAGKPASAFRREGKGYHALKIVHPIILISKSKLLVF